MAELGRQAKRKLYLKLLQKIGVGETLTQTELKTFNVLSAEFEQEEREDESSEAPDAFKSYQEAADYAGITKRTIHYHVKKGRIRVNGDGTIPRESMDEYLASRTQSGRGGDRRPGVGIELDLGNIGLERDLADLRYRLAKAEREEIATALLKGAHLPKEEIEAALSEMILVSRKAFMLLPRVAAARLAGLKEPSIIRILTEMVDEILNGLADGASISKLQRRLRKIGIAGRE